MSGKNTNFNDKKINRSNFYRSKNLFKVDDIDINRILSLASSNDWNAIHFESNKTMSFKVLDEKVLKKSTKIWNEISSLMDIEIGSELVYSDSDKYIKTKITSYGDKVNTDF